MSSRRATTSAAAARNATADDDALSKVISQMNRLSIRDLLSIKQWLLKGRRGQYRKSNPSADWEHIQKSDDLKVLIRLLSHVNCFMAFPWELRGENFAAQYQVIEKGKMVADYCSTPFIHYVAYLLDATSENYSLAVAKVAQQLASSTMAGLVEKAMTLIENRKLPKGIDNVAPATKLAHFMVTQAILEIGELEKMGGLDEEDDDGEAEFASQGEDALMELKKQRAAVMKTE